MLPADARVHYAETGHGYDEAIEALAGLAGRHRDLAASLEAGRALEGLATADEPTAIAAGVLRLARRVAMACQGRPAAA